MKIAVIVDEFPSLSQTFVLSQITGLIDQGHEVDIYANRAKEQPKTQPDIHKYQLLDCTVYWHLPETILAKILGFIPTFLMAFFQMPLLTLLSINPFIVGRKAFSLRVFYVIAALIKSGRAKQAYDILFCHFGGNGVLGMHLRSVGALQGKLVTVFHGIDLSLELKLFGQGIYDQLFRQGDLFLPISDRWKQKLIELGCPAKKIITHRMGIDLSKFRPQRTSENRAQDSITLLSVCRLTPKKGVEYGIRAVASLLDKEQKIHYYIIGDGEEKEKLTALIDQLSAQTSIHLLGWKNETEILEFLQSCDVFIAPSVTSERGDEEGIPMVLMEAMAMEIPVVSTFHSGIPELVKDRYCGLLAPERNVEQLATNIKLLTAQLEARQKMGKLGRTVVEAEYNLHKLNQKLELLFLKTIKPNLENELDNQTNK
ncbi:MAG TPA: glycosyltransferase [Leptolyngbyaceae cyanobacterium M33_DOE_097]|nr:glycosyltransferase [Leptolyngbyaceae cyanobacterium M33_DOE_097]